jgi:hypothetical protein
MTSQLQKMKSAGVKQIVNFGAPAKPFGPDRHHSLEGKDMFAEVWKNGELAKAP